MEAEQRAVLERLQADIGAALERCQEEEPEAALLPRLNEAVEEFEVSHPNLTTAIGQVMDILSRSGI